MIGGCLTWILNKAVLSEGCPHNYYRSMSKTIKLYWKVVRRIVLGNRLTIHVGEAHELLRRVIQQIHLGGLSNIFISEGFPQIKQIFLFGNGFHT